MALFTADDPEFTKNDTDFNILRKSNTVRAKKLEVFLQRFYKNEIEGKPIRDFTQLKKRLSPTLESIARKEMIESFTNGGQYVANKFNLQSVPVYNLEGSDYDLIDAELRPILDKFWTNVEKIETRNQNLADNTTEAGNNQEPITIDSKGDVHKKQELEHAVYIGGVSRLLVFFAFNLGISNAPSSIIRGLEKAGVDTFSADIDYITENFMLRFKTRGDHLVDKKRCLPLTNALFPLDSKIRIPVPPLHLHCRCILVLVKRKKV